MSLSKSSVILLAILTLVTASVTLTSPVVAQDGIDSSNLEIGDISVPSEVELGDETQITSSATIPPLPADWSAQLEFVAYADDRQVGTQKVSIEDGDTADVSVSHSFQQAGSKELYFDVTGELTREGAVTEQSAAIDRTTQAVTIDVTPEQVTTEGAAFTAPESIQDDIDDVRGEIPEIIRDKTNAGDSAHAFVLTSANESFIVFTNEDPKEGYASVEGFSPSNVVETDELDFGVIVASDVEFKSPTEVSVSEVYEDAGDYDREYIKINAHHRNIAINYEGGSSTTTGVLVADPLETGELFGSVGSNSRAALKNPDGDNIESVLGGVTQDRIVTASFGTEEYWTDGEVTITGITAAPGSRTQDFIQSFHEDEILPTDSSTPVVYVIDEEYSAQEVSSVSEISGNADEFDGELVSLESNLVQTTISTESVFRKATGTPLPVDTILHGGAAWDQLPETRDEVMIMMAASSVKQRQSSEIREGKYQITGEVISTDRIEGDLPDGSILVVYDLERIGGLDTAVNDVIQNQASGVSETLEQQANPEIDASAVDDTDEEVDETQAVQDTDNKIDDTEDVQDTADGRTDETENVQNTDDEEVKEVAPEIDDSEPDSQSETEVKSVADEGADQESVVIHTAGESESVQEIRFDGQFDGSTTVEEYHDEDLIKSVGESIEHAVSTDLEGNEETIESVNVATVTRITPDDPEREATIVMSVDREDINNPQSARIYHENGSSWESLPTQVEEMNEEEILLSGETGGFSLFAVAEVETGSEEAAEVETEPQEGSEDGGNIVLGLVLLTIPIVLILAPIAVLVIILILLKRRFIG